MAEKLSLRQRNRLAAMRLVQTAAVAMFETDGFDATTIESIADASGMSPSTIYRHFGTKEALVLWDERDPVVDTELTQRLGRQPPIQAFKDAVTVALAQRDDLALFLRRLRLIYTEPTIWGAAAQQDRRNRAGLAAAFAATRGREQAILADEVAAATCLAALDIALDQWQQTNGETNLAELIEQAVTTVTSLS